MAFGISEKDVETAARVIAASKMIETPQLPPACWMGLARNILEEVAREQNRRHREQYAHCGY